jgi:hypothetical protein
MIEDGEEDSVRGGSVGEDAHGSGSVADFPEASLDRVGGSGHLSFGQGGTAPAGEELVEAVGAGDFDTQCSQVFANIPEALRPTALSLRHS